MPYVTTPSAGGARVLVVDDDPGVATIVERALTYEGHEVVTAADGESALRAIGERTPELVVLDLMLPDIDGVEVCRRIRRIDPAIAVLMLTARDGQLEQVAGLDAGADDYMVKPFSLTVLTARVRALLRRREPPRRTATYADLSLDESSRVARRGEREIQLTRTEFRLLQELMRTPERVIPKLELTRRVWGYDFRGDDNVLEVYIRYLRQKLGEPRLIQTFRGAGYALRLAT